MVEKKNDFNSEEYTKKIEGLDKFREEFSGKNFDKKICEAIKDSRELEKEIKTIVWETVKSKLVWIILTGLGLIFTDLLLKSIPSILSSVFGSKQL